MSEDEAKECAVCHKAKDDVEAGLLKCSRCKDRTYCGKLPVRTLS